MILVIVRVMEHCNTHSLCLYLFSLFHIHMYTYMYMSLCMHYMFVFCICRVFICMLFKDSIHKTQIMALNLWLPFNIANVNIVQISSKLQIEDYKNRKRDDILLQVQTPKQKKNFKYFHSC